MIFYICYAAKNSEPSDNFQINGNNKKVRQGCKFESKFGLGRIFASYPALQGLNLQVFWFIILFSESIAIFPQIHSLKKKSSTRECCVLCTCRCVASTTAGWSGWPEQIQQHPSGSSAGTYIPYLTLPYVPEHYIVGPRRRERAVDPNPHSFSCLDPDPAGKKLKKKLKMQGNC